MNVAYIGLEACGRAFARRLASSHPTQVYDANSSYMQTFGATNAIHATDLPSLASASNVVLLCLADQDLVEEALFGPIGLGQGLHPGSIVIDQTTGEPARTRALAARLAAGYETVLIDAPTSADPDDIAAGTACLMCGGPQAAVEAARPILSTLSDSIVYCGETGSGHAAALVSHAVALCNRLITYEGASLAVKYGIDLAVLSTVINKSGAWNGASERVLPVLGAGGDTSCRPLAQIAKDLQTAMHVAAGFGAPMFIANAVRSLIEVASNDPEPAAGEDDIARLFEKMADIGFAGA